ncbi:transposase [Endosaccharibacter trunci]|uniref:transposase n=1 Tax=Endosaccharibacter trunci TaxID=2812733 RepID=UPI003BF5E165
MFDALPDDPDVKYAMVDASNLYKARRLIENYFAKLKEFKRIAMRSDKTDRSFTAMLHLAATITNSR